MNFESSQSGSQPSQAPSRRNSFQANEGYTSNVYPEAHHDYQYTSFQPPSSDEQNQADSQQQAFLATLEYPAWQAYEDGKPYDCVDLANKSLENSVPLRPSGLGQIPGHGIGQVPNHDAGPPDTRQVSGQLMGQISRKNSGEVPGHHSYDEVSAQVTDELQRSSSDVVVSGQGTEEVLNRTLSCVQGQTSVQILRRTSSQAVGNSWGPVPGHGIGQGPTQSVGEVVGHGSHQIPYKGVGTDPPDKVAYPRQRFHPAHETYHMYQVHVPTSAMDDQQRFQGARPQLGHPYRRGHYYQSYRMHQFTQQYWRPAFVAPFHKGHIQPARPQNRRAFQFDCSTPAFVPQFPGNRQLELEILAQASSIAGSANPHLYTHAHQKKKTELPWVWWSDAINTEKYLKKHKDGEGRVFFRLKDTPLEKRRTSPDEIDIWVDVGTVPSIVEGRPKTD
ncbi:hypothetical protein, conserved [Eimeria praecox]|uniref:Uncharacterized protein n=1 Tax=Eimeria praecox TaxID=51316 RepID=U6G0V7_9EIME|nr:hypothetical protein, conserved [Eimeria praecox]